MTTETKAAGNRGKGRKKGQVNKTTAALKEAILLAAEDVGSDGRGKGGLQGYLRFLARHEAKAFAGLLGKVLPMSLEHSGDLVIQINRLSDADRAPS